MKNTNKSAILVVSFGTSYEDTRKITLDAIEEKIREEFKEFEVRKAYTSNMIIKKLKERDGIFVDTPMEALSKLKEDGYEKIIVQPLHVMPGEEYDKIKLCVHRFEKEESFHKIVLGKPLLYQTKDYEIVIEAMKEELVEKNEDKALVLMGHGSYHHANSCYALLDYMLKSKGYENTFVATVEETPTLEDAIKRLKDKNIKEVILKPFMIVSGDHAKNDMASDEEDSWKTILEKEGFKVNINLHALGENENIRQIYINNIKSII
ncbi:sirohydrochlorin cobaltochelatase [Clostridium novyi]|uniref:Anaerobic cobalt chelatase n=1 Tax=Clostridium novyi (strain NT) TaxID=386415 RepID=A0Q337_CLONN|nr:sirohydrochlorin cobaltochelatase [Clostridium novyi]ABK60611.1 anaerobic cobalt chelatase [Clostridium novyi NT]KEH87050.1 sirohydrochlorin cobaltochelatase [Clostridium novyi A str. NCTC 538]KEH88265.1 sirohydrochlorin cobaltochelatase [Clostridium novyi A str. 4540]KEH91140.1 sirohydrochlorin cobaltochelatase [Clostridium novyi A str. BKT29909]KEH94850.1 sirohydrochlorin cobaltochelatase [Clostridium novyi A str. GD211209]